MTSSAFRILTVLALGTAVVGAVEGPQYDVCRKQIGEYVSQRFQQNVTDIDFAFNYEDRPRIASPAFGSNNQAVVYTDGCDGYHVFEIHGTYFDCEHRAHYGTPPNYIYYRTSADGCKAG